MEPGKIHLLNAGRVVALTSLQLFGSYDTI